MGGYGSASIAARWYLSGSAGYGFVAWHDSRGDTGIGGGRGEGVGREAHRRSGGGRKRLTDQQPEILTALEKLIEPTTRGDPMSPLRWTCKSTRKLAEELQGQGFQIGERKVAACSMR